MRVRRKGYVAGRGKDITEDWAAVAACAKEHLMQYRCIASYAAAGSEISTSHLESVLHAAGITLTLPCVSEKDDAPLLFARYEPGDILKTDTPKGIQEPCASAKRLVPDLVLVPLLAVDSRGIRLGQGAGHYDRTLRFLRRNGAVKAIGVAYDCQVIDHVPDDPWDEALDAVVTPKGWIACSG